MKFRKAIFWLHLFSGIFTGIVVLIMSVTGVALTYQKQMTAWADKKMYQIQAPSNAAPLSATALIESYSRAKPAVTPISLSLSSDPAMPASIMTAPNAFTFINPYTGEILGEGSQGIRKFFRVMTDWHRWLALSGEKRGIGKAITGACNFVYLFLAVSGLYLWWPRRWTRGIFQTIGWFRAGLTGKARDFNWHHVLGFWCLVPLILIIISAVVISYPWAGRLLFRMSGSQMSFQAGPPGGHRGGPPAGPGPRGSMPGGGPMGERAPLQLAGIDRIVESIQKQSAAWKSISFQLPTVKDKAVAIAVETGSAGQPQHRTTITVDNATGTILKSEGFKALDPGLRARMWMRFVHTGEYYGLSGQTIAGIASLAGVILVWTGFALTYRRFFSSPEQEKS
jgi:uncharacterized iron-regulated membrane protein